MPNQSQGQDAAARAPVVVWRAELILLVLAVVLGMGIWVWVDREVIAMMDSEEPREELFQAAQQVPARQSRLAMAQDEQKAIQDQLIKARIELAAQTANVDALLAVYPQFETITTTKTLPPSVPVERVNAYLDARVKQEAARRQANALKEQLATIQSEVAQASSELQTAQRTAREQFRREQARYRLTKPGMTFGLTLAVLIALTVLMTIVHLIAARSVNQPQFQIRGCLTLFGTVGVLAVLLGYQSFEIAGAAFMGVLVLLVLLPLLARLAPPPSSE